MRLRLAELLARTGNYVDVVPVLVGLAEEMQAAGQRARALAILQKIEFIDHQGPKEVGIAPLTRAPRGSGREGPGDAVLAYVTTGQPAPSAEAAAHFRRWLQELMGEARDAGAADPPTHSSRRPKTRSSGTLEVPAPWPRSRTELGPSLPLRPPRGERSRWPRRGSLHTR